PCPARHEFSPLSLHDALPMSGFVDRGDRAAHEGEIVDDGRTVGEFLLEQLLADDVEPEQLAGLLLVGRTLAEQQTGKLFWFDIRSEEHTSELQSLTNLLYRLL